MKIYFATDHAGFDMKEMLLTYVRNDLGYEVEDCGAHEHDPADDYPDFISKAAQKISENPDDRAIIFGGSGQAEAICANRFPRVRAALCYGAVAPIDAIDVAGNTSDERFIHTKLSREHNNTNVLSLGARFLSDDDARAVTKLWLETPFSGDERHIRRLDKIELYP